MATLIEDLKMFTPKNDEEAADYTLLLEAAHREEAYNRAWPAHFTASAWVVNPLRTKTLMIYHNIYQSWSWIGGHADGIHDLSLVAAKELEEETGLSSAKMAHSGLLSCETLTVDGHWKRGAYVPSHLHLNATYLFEANEKDTLLISPRRKLWSALAHVRRSPYRVNRALDGRARISQINRAFQIAPEATESRAEEPQQARLNPPH